MTLLVEVISLKEADLSLVLITRTALERDRGTFSQQQHTAEALQYAQVEPPFHSSERYETDSCLRLGWIKSVYIHKCQTSHFTSCKSYLTVQNEASFFLSLFYNCISFSRCSCTVLVLTTMTSDISIIHFCST